ncbi:MAG: hypothetical protein IT489_01460 [Gammaproteobacteria bacterium]|nr:hypothetical protein [Gammaproteobacteria bacterium]
MKATSAIRPPIFEIIGVAGSGKTTLIKALSETRNIAIKLTIRELVSSKLFWIDYAARAIWSFRSCLLGYRDITRLPEHSKIARNMFSYAIEEKRQLARLMAFNRECLRYTSEIHTSRVIDQGPIFSLAFLKVLRAEETCPDIRDILNHEFGLLCQQLNGVIYLTGSETDLHTRRQSRPSSAIYQKVFKTEDYIARFHADYLEAYKEIIARLIQRHAVPVVELDTTQYTIDEVIEMSLGFMLENQPHQADIPKTYGDIL